MPYQNKQINQLKINDSKINNIMDKIEDINNNFFQENDLLLNESPICDNSINKIEKMSTIISNEISSNNGYIDIDKK